LAAKRAVIDAALERAKQRAQQGVRDDEA
jgi:hypothetical protein